MILSILPNTKKGMTTYYVGDNVEHISHLKECTLYCSKKFDIDNSVKQVIVTNPQLEFYKLSHKVKYEFNFKKDIYGNYQYSKGINCDIDSTCVIGHNVKIGDDVTIGPNTTIYSNTTIDNNTVIGANCTIGTSGMLWVWDGDGKIFLKQLGGVRIGKNCILGSNCVVVRGSANENTILDDGVNMAPGCCIGHGTFIGKNTHLANNLSIGGSVDLGSYNFYGCGAVVNPGVKVKVSDVILGAGSTLTKSLDTSGVYYGIPAKKIKNITNKHSGVPTWRQ